jgi:hypothetical protein
VCQGKRQYTRHTIQASKRHESRNEGRTKHAYSHTLDKTRHKAKEKGEGRETRKYNTRDNHTCTPNKEAALKRRPILNKLGHLNTYFKYKDKTRQDKDKTR